MNTSYGINVYLNNVNYKAARAFHNALNVNGGSLNEAKNGKQKLSSRESDFTTQKERLKRITSEKVINVDEIKKAEIKPTPFELGGIMDFRI